MKYDAFISYRHSELDMFVAKKIHKGLETFKVPRQVRKIGGKSKISRVFRDQEELPIGSDLGDNISGALKESEYLLVICSPRTPESYWVQKEIDTFISLHPRDHILAILVEGEPNESFPSQLLNDENGNPVEPLAADVRGDNIKEVNKKLKTEIIRLAAPILHCSYDDLRQRHRERRIKKIFSIVTAAFVIIAALGIGFGIYNARMANEIAKNYKEKQITQSKSLADTSLSLYKEGDLKTAALVAVSALPSEQNDRPYVADAENALSKALHVYDSSSIITKKASFKHDLTVADMYFDETGNYLVTIDRSATVYVWDMEKEECIFKVYADFSSYGDVESTLYANVISDKLVIVRTSSVSAYSLDGTLMYREESEKEYHSCKESLESGLLVLETVSSVLVFDTDILEVTAKIDCPDESKYIQETAISKNGKYIAVSYGDMSTGYTIFVSDINGKIVSYHKPTETYISEMIVDDEGNVVCVDYPLYGSLVSEAVTTSVNIDYFSIASDTESPVWNYAEDVQTMLFMDGYTLLRFFDIEIGDGAGTNVIIVSLIDKVITFSHEGEIYSEIYSGTTIASILCTYGGHCFMFLRDGSLKINSLLNGRPYNNNSFEEIGSSISSIITKNGVFAIRGYLTPDVLIMKNNMSEKAELINTFEKSYSSSVSEDGETVCFYESDYSEELNRFNFLNTATNEITYSFEYKDAKSITSYGFVTNDLYYAADISGKILLINFKNKEVKEIPIPADYFSLKGIHFTNDGKFYIVNSSFDMSFYDMENNRYKHIFKDNEQSIHDSFINNAGTTAYYFERDCKLRSVNIETEEIKDDYDESLVTTPSFLELGLFKFSDDSSKFILCCRDGYLKVVDTLSGEILDEISFNCRYRGYVSFIEDSKKLLLQGEDYIIKIYNLETKEFEFISDEQYNAIKYVRDEADKLYLVNDYEMLALTKDPYAIQYSVDSGIEYIASTNKILAKNGQSLYSLDYIPYQDLIALTAEKFNNATLSETEKIKYHVD